MAWKVRSMLQAGEDVAASAFPGGGYRVRFTHGVNAATLGGQLAAQIAGGKYVLPYIETESTYPLHDENGVVDADPRQSDAVWETKMIAFADAFASAGVEYIEFGNEPNHPTNVVNRHRVWDSYADRLKKSAPIWRERGIGVMLAGIGPSQFTAEYLSYLAGKGAFKAVDCAAIHAYSGGVHADGSAAGGLPADTLRRCQDARAAFDALGYSWIDLHVTELGWPTIADAATDPGHQTYCTPAQQATRLEGLFNLLYANAAALRLRTIGWFHSTDYRNQTDPPGGDTPGNWAHHHGIRWEAGTPRCAAEGGGACHKPSWDSFVNTAGIGRGTAGVKPDVVTGAVSNITGPRATIGATIQPRNLPTPWWVEHGPDENFGTRSAIQPPVTGPSAVPVSLELTGLTTGATHHARVVGSNDAGSGFGQRITFVATAPPPPPTPLPGDDLYPSESLWPSENLWPARGPGIVVPPGPGNPPVWTRPRRFTPKPGTLGTRATRCYHPRGYTLDLAVIIEAGGLVTQDPYVKGALRDSGFFDESDP